MWTKWLFAAFSIFAAAPLLNGEASAFEKSAGPEQVWTPPFCSEDLFASELHCAPRADGSSPEQYRQLNKIDTRTSERRKPYPDLFSWTQSR